MSLSALRAKRRITSARRTPSRACCSATSRRSRLRDSHHRLALSIRVPSSKRDSRFISIFQTRCPSTTIRAPKTRSDVQEIVTNTTRHAHAQSPGFDSRQCRRHRLHARDDGGRDAVVVGNGLTGMRERFEQLPVTSSSPPISAPGSRFRLLRPGARMIRLVLVDDQTLVRQGIRSLLELVSRVDRCRGL